MAANLRQALRSDVPGMQRVRRSVTENPLTTSVVSDDDVIEAIERTGRGWVVEEDGRVVGFAIGHAGTGNIWALFVEPGHEARGHGRALHDAMVAWLRAQGLVRLWLTTGPATRAARFYAAAGWELAGTEPNGELLFEMRADASA